MSESDDKKLEKQFRMAAIDIVTSVVIMAVSVAVIYWSMQMPWERWARAPGLVPVLFAGTMFIMALSLMISAIRKRGLSKLGKTFSDFSFSRFFGDTKTKRSIWIIFLVTVYLVVLTGRVPFEIAGILFLFATFSVFWKKGGWLKIALISVLVPLVFSALFRLLFKILLPGDSIFDWFL